MLVCEEALVGNPLSHCACGDSGVLHGLQWISQAPVGRVIRRQTINRVSGQTSVLPILIGKCCLYVEGFAMQSWLGCDVVFSLG